MTDTVGRVAADPKITVREINASKIEARVGDAAGPLDPRYFVAPESAGPGRDEAERISALGINAEAISGIKLADSLRPGESLQPEETPGAWSFKSGAVAAKFDDHVREQLPWYDVLSQYTADLATSFIPNGGLVYDIGASTGNMARLLEGTLENKGARIVSVEPSFEMLAHFHGPGELLATDAERIDYSADRPDVVILFLTLMFMKPAARRDFLSKLLWNLQPGGAILLVDKGYLDHPQIQVACKAAQLAQKMRSGAPAQSYITKELSLRGEQRPSSGYVIGEMMNAADFVYEEVFRFGEFYGLLGVKRSV